MSDTFQEGSGMEGKLSLANPFLRLGMYVFKPWASITCVIKKQFVFRNKPLASGRWSQVPRRAWLGPLGPTPAGPLVTPRLCAWGSESRPHLGITVTPYWTVWKHVACGPRKEVSTGEPAAEQLRVRKDFGRFPHWGPVRGHLYRGTCRLNQVPILPPSSSGSKFQKLAPHGSLRCGVSAWRGLQVLLAETPRGEPLSAAHTPMLGELSEPRIQSLCPASMWPPHPLEHFTCPFLSFVRNQSIFYDVNGTWHVFYLLHSFMHSFIASFYCWLGQLITAAYLLPLSARCWVRSWACVGNGVQSHALSRLQQGFNAVSSGSGRRDLSSRHGSHGRLPLRRWGLSRFCWQHHRGLSE